MANKPMLGPMTGALSKLLKLEYLDQFYNETRESAAGSGFLGEVLSRLKISVDISPEDLARIPKTGPVVAVANHPFGMVEGIAAAWLLAQHRPDFRVLANDMLGAFSQIRPFLILVDPFGGEAANRFNRRGLREALQWLEKGGMLLIFPAGEVSHMHFRRPGIHDPDWHRTAAALLKHTGAAALPFYFEGSNSALFQIAGMVHPRLRTALLPRELVNKQGQVLRLRVGHPLAASKFESLDDERATELLRRKTYWLANRRPSSAKPARQIREDDPLFEPIPADWLRAELNALPAERILVESGDWQVIEVTRNGCPFTVREIGRLREQTFRKAGEGTGKAVDLDDFDDHYVHLVLWRKDSWQIAGAYRLCGTDRAGGRLYTKTLYRFSPQFFEQITPALELGRSFIRPEHQRSFQPLLLLWRAIGEYVARNPRYRYLFGPVSISNLYQKASRVLMADTLVRLVGMPEVASLAKPRRPFIHMPVNGLPRPESIEDMESWISDLEPTGAGLPVLIRQYLKMGGRFATFHVDHSFGKTLDGLIVVDLTKTEPKFLERYLGKEGAANFRAYHQSAGASCASAPSPARG